MKSINVGIAAACIAFLIVLVLLNPFNYKNDKSRLHPVFIIIAALMVASVIGLVVYYLMHILSFGQ